MIHNLILCSLFFASNKAECERETQCSRRRRFRHQSPAAFNDLQLLFHCIRHTVSERSNKKLQMRTLGTVPTCSALFIWIGWLHSQVLVTSNAQNKIPEANKPVWTDIKSMPWSRELPADLYDDGPRAVPDFSQLRSPLRWGERGSGSFQCKLCGKAYSRSTGLGNHMELHRGITTCTVCQKVFATKSTLKLHLRCVHGRELV